MGIVQNVLSATELAIGRNPNIVWIDRPDEFTYTPDTGGSGANLGLSVVQAVSAYITISPRFVAGRKSAFLTVSRALWSAAYAYSITVNGETYTSTGAASSQTTVQDLVDQINADASVDLDPRAIAIPRTTDGVVDTVWVWALDDVATATPAVLTVDAATDHPIEGAIEAYVDAAACKARLWVRHKRPAELPVDLPWVVPALGDLGAIPSRGFVERYNVASFERLYVEIYDLTKAGGDGSGVAARPFVCIAPAIPEE